MGVVTSLQDQAVQRLLDSMPDGVLIVSAEGGIEFANRQAEVLTGYAGHELVEMSVEDLVPAGLRRAHADHRAVYGRRPALRAMGSHIDISIVCAHRFIERHRGELLTVPVAVYGMGPREADEEAWRRSRGQLDRALAKRDWLAPAATALFGGVDPPRRRGGPRRDQRDWEAIRGWANAIAGLASKTTPAVRS